METDRNDTDSRSELTELLTEGDTELWYAEGRDGSWSFPLWLKWARVKDGKRYALIDPALTPYYKQGLYLKALFEAHNLIERDNQWMVRAEAVPALLKKAPGVTPKFYYKWKVRGEEIPEMIERVRPRTNHSQSRAPWGNASTSDNERQYVSLIAQAAGVSTSVVKVVLDGLSRAAVDILVEKRGVLDLGFVKLVALPYRANWKEIVSFKLRKSRKTDLVRKGRKGKKDALAEAEIPEMLCSPHNIGMKRRKESELGHLDYTIEAIPMKPFETELRKREATKTAAGRSAYVRFFETTVEKLYDEILEVLQTYLHKTNYSFARVHESSGSGSLRFVASLGHTARAFGFNLNRLPVHIVANRTGFSALADSDASLLVHSPTTELPEVSALLSPAPQLRERTESGAVEELSDGTGGAAGLPLLHAGQMQNPGGGLLPLREAGGE